jgi:glycosyltransferase involved in cell wall biosynthesis
MKVAVIHNLRKGGAHRRLTGQLRHLNADVFEVCPETAQPVTDTPIVVPLRLRAPSAPRHWRPVLRYVDHRAIELAWREVTTAVREREADVVFANPCRFLQAPAALLDDLPPSLYFCDEARRVDHDEGARETLNVWTRPLYAPMYRRQTAVDRAATERATLIATNSRFAAGVILRAYGRSAEVVPMGVADAFLDTPPIVSRRDEFVLSVGTLIPTKGHGLVIEAVAVATTRRPVVVVAPSFSDSEAARLRLLANTLGVSLEIRTSISDGNLRDLYACAHVTMYLAQEEPFGLASLEAQACGCPVIVSDEGGLPETIVEGRTGSSAPREPAAIARRLDQLDDLRLHASQSAAAAEHARAWSWDLSARKLNSLLARLVGSPSTAGRVRSASGTA